MRLKIAIAVLTLMVAGGGAVDRQTPVAQAQDAEPALTGDVVVKFRDGTTLAGVGAALARAEAAPVQSTRSGAVLLEPETGQSVDDAVAALNADPNVLYAEPDALVSIDATPNDTYYAGYQAWHFDQINAPAAWDTETGATSTVIAVVDTGVQTTHTDLNGNVVAGANFVRVPIGTSSNSGGQVRITTTTPHPYLNGEQVTVSGHSVGSVNGTWTISMPAALNIASSSVSSGTITVTTSAAHGLSVGEFVMVRDHSIGGANGQWTVTAVPSATQFRYSCTPDCANGSGSGGVAKQATWFNLSGSSYSSAGTGGNALNTSPRDDEGHGTSVAGFAAAESNNGEGVAGVCWTCKIMPVKVLGATGSGSGLDVADGIEWAVDNGADVINLSLSSPSSSTPMLDAVNYAWNNGVIVVAASGNDGDTLDPSVRYPAKYANAIAVGATDASAVRATFSNYGPELDVVAPGEAVTSTSATGFGTGNGWYATGSGTSFATPHVAGVVGLMISHGITDKTAIVSALTSTAVDAGAAGLDNLYGHGIVDALAALGSSTYGVAWGSDSTPSTMVAGADSTATLSFTNNGTLDWTPTGTNPVRVSYHWRSGTCPSSGPWTWDGVRTSLPVTVTAGDTVSDLSATVRAPAPAGTYCLVYDLVQEGVTWFSSQGAAVKMKTITVNQAVYGVTWGADSTPSTMIAGANTSATVSFTNTGSLQWNPGGSTPVRMSYHWRPGACPNNNAWTWDGFRTLLPGVVANGGNVDNLVTTVRAPGSAGTYCLVYDLVHEGVTWFSRAGAATHSRTVTVNSAAYGVTWGDEVTPSTMGAGADVSVNVSFSNAGSMSWNAGGGTPVRFSYHWRSGACPNNNAWTWDGLRTLLPGNIAPGGDVTALDATIRAPGTPGTYCLVYDLVHEGVTWFSSQGAPTLSATVTIT